MKTPKGQTVTGRIPSEPVMQDFHRMPDMIVDNQAIDLKTIDYSKVEERIMTQETKDPWCFQEWFFTWHMWGIGWKYRGLGGWDYDELSIQIGPVRLEFVR